MQRSNQSFTNKQATTTLNQSLGSSTPSKIPKSRMGKVSYSTKSTYKGIFLILAVFLLLCKFFPGKNGFIDRSELDKYTLDHLESYQFAIVADLDRMSKETTASKPTWRSILKFGQIYFDRSLNRWNIDINEDYTHNIYSNLGEAGRGMELSELLYVDNQLLSFDDRSGTVFQLTNGFNPLTIDLSKDFQCIPRYIVTEGDGTSAKGQKTEWATVKDNEVYIGSFGKEFTLNTGEVAHRKNLWISIIGIDGKIRHENWTEIYEKLRKATGTSFPGYMIHEAIHFNSERREWIILPRRVSTDPYDEKLDELKGSNIFIVANEDFSDIKVRTVGTVIPERGFSSFKFLPGTKGKVIVALKTVEKEDKVTGDSEQTSFITMFDLTGRILVPDIEIAGEAKFEGIEFL